MDFKADVAACLRSWTDQYDYWQGRIGEQFCTMYEDPMQVTEFWNVAADLVVTDYCVFKKPEIARDTDYHYKLVTKVASEIEAADGRLLLHERDRA
jgi:hypothetical protein